MGPWRLYKLRSILAHCAHLFFTSIRAFVYYFWCSTASTLSQRRYFESNISDFYDVDFSGQNVFKLWVLSVSFEALAPITAIFIPAADGVLLLHYLAAGPVILHFNIMVLKCVCCIVLVTFKCFTNWVRCIAFQLIVRLQTGLASLASRFSIPNPYPL